MQVPCRLWNSRPWEYAHLMRFLNHYVIWLRYRLASLKPCFSIQIRGEILSLMEESKYLWFRFSSGGKTTCCSGEGAQGSTSPCHHGHKLYR